MSSSDPKRSQDTTPRRTPASVLPEAPKKADKKMEPTVVVAIISAIVTLVTAILSSPLLLTLVNRDPTTVPSAAELGMSGTLVPGPAQSSPGEGLTKAMDDPTESVDSTSAENSPTVISTDLASPTENAAPPSQATLDPENTPVPPTAPPAAASVDCFAVDVWFPFPTTLDPGTTGGCWNMAEWGFTTTGGQISLVHNPAQNQQRGVFLPISGDVVIQFTLQMNEFRTRSNDGAFLHFGIVQDDPFSNYSGGYLSYQQPSPGASSPIRVLVNGTNQATQTVLILEKGFQHAVKLTVTGDLLTVFLDGAPAGEPVNLPLTDRAFWIGYVLPGKAEIDVKLTGFSIQAP